jgi:hypothetical protein
MSAELPIHVQMLLALKIQVQTRQREHERRVGKGLEDREYQRHVGRIAECEVQASAIDEMLKTDLDDVSDYLEQAKSDNEGQRRTTRTRRAQRT